MFLFKRALATGITALTLAGMLPATTLADPPLPAGTALITVTSVTPSFDPSINQVAAINYTVSGPAPAGNVFIRIYKESITDESRICNNLPENYVATIEGLINRPVGNYTAVWTGRNQNGSVVPAGDYCFDLRWENMPPGVLTTFLEGRIDVAQPSYVAPGTGTGTGGTGAGGTGGAGAGGAGSQPAGPISASVDPLVINPTATEGNAAYINYIVNQNFPNGFTLKIYDSGNFVVKDLYGTTQRVPAGTRATIAWNGRRNNGAVVAPGDYFYKFRVAGADVATGLIRVEYPVSGLPQADIIHYANPSVINPLATPAQIATIYYTVNRRFTTGLTITIKNGSNTIRTLFGTTAPVNTGNYQLAWNGRYNNEIVVPVGTYRYVFSSGGQEIGFGTIGVVYGDSTQPPSQPPQAQFVTSHSAQPATFTPALGQTTTITYTLGKSVVNFKFSIRNQLGAEMVTETAASRTAETYPYVWNGMVGSVPVPAGIYTYVLEAANENPVSGSVTVASLPQGVPVITDLGPDPASFQIAAGQTNLRYQVSQNARCDLTVWNGTPGLAGSIVIRRLQNGIASFVTTCSTGATVFVPWDGKNDAGAYVAAGTYYYLIEAVNTNSTAQPRSGTVTVSSIPPPAVLDVSNLSASRNPFNPEVDITDLRFSLNYSANVTVTVSRASDNAFVKTVVSNQPYAVSGVTIVGAVWNGTDSNGQLVPQGVYNFRVDATSAQYGSDSGSASVTVNRGFQSQVLDVSNVFASPNPFNPEVQNTALTFSLNYPANVTITVRRAIDNAFVKTVVSNQYYNAGTNLTVAWNGTDSNNIFVPNDTYNVRVDATNAQYGSDFAAANVTVSRTNTLLQILGGDSANPNPFNPSAGQVSRVDFSTTVTPSVLTVRIYRNSTNVFVRELPVLTLGTNAYRAEWNGRDGATNSIVSNDYYTYRIEAAYAGQTVQKSGSVTVGNVGTPPPPPPPENCGYFTDIAPSHSLCAALDFVQSRGIFRGYDDGSIGLDRVIQRAELLAVIQKAFQYPLDAYSPEADGNLGHPDLTNKTHMWYMPYLKTFKRLGLMVGYPDGNMRPERTMNTAELYVVFLKAAKQAPLDIAHFSLANQELTKFAPFRDTPKSRDTAWYLRYAGFAKLNGLVTAERFHPDRGITRGQVIKLIYDTHVKGLITYGSPL